MGILLYGDGKWNEYNRNVTISIVTISGVRLLELGQS